MAFQVYYRKWRPQSFGQLVGQDHVSRTLRQAVQRGRVAHSYLFCGPRGTGKTSSARVLAKAVNCLDPREGDPCNECARCLAINEARFMDLIEMDAASNRGIDEIRNIRDRVNLAPVEGGSKVYIIDEAHMLTEHASNAFLKTLEEPPAHAIFILCTTEPHKILPTIISRCQRLDFRRLASDAVVGRLRGICHEEGVDSDEEALRLLAQGSGGSLRDAENLLEQLVVSCDGRVGVGEVRELLGLGQGEEALEFTRSLVSGNAASALSTINRAAWEGVDLRVLHRQVVDLLRGVLLIQCGSRESLDLPKETVKELEDLAPRATTARIMKSLKLLGEINMRYDSSSPLPLELAVVEACMEGCPEAVPSRPAPAVRPVSSREPSSSTPVPVPSNGPPTRAPAVAQSRRSPEVPVVAAPSPDRARDKAGAPATPVPGAQGPDLQEGWTTAVKILSRCKGKRFNIGALLRDCKEQRIEGETLVLAFAHRSHLERMQEEIDDPQGQKTVEEALLKSLGTSYRLRVVLADDSGVGNGPSAAQSPLVRAALSMGARITEEREQ